MTWDEVRDFILPMAQVYYRGEMKHLLTRVNELTSFLDFHPRVPSSVRTYCIKNNIDCIEKHPICSIDGCDAFVMILSGNKGFSSTCSKECMTKARAVVHRKNFKEKHGVDNPALVDSFMEKRKATNRDRYGVKKESKQEKKGSHHQHVNIDELNDKVHPTLQIKKFIESLGLEVECNRRDILPNRKEIDIYVPSLSLAIEYNGLRWHSTEMKSSPRCHLDKTEEAESIGVRLVHIFEDEWIDRHDQVLNKIKALCGVRDKTLGARKTHVVSLDTKQTRELLDSSHIQGYGRGSTLSYGLVHGEDVVACMTFMNKGDGVWDLTRFATSMSVVGGFTKLLSHFKKNNEWSEIISFADRRWSQGDLYEKNGFSEVYRTKPNYFYVEGKRRVRKEHYRRDKLETKLKHFDPSLSEKENTEANGIYRIYDCGLIKYSMIC